MDEEQTARSSLDEANKTKAVSKIGKFDSAESLLSAYNALEAEFTKRCQKLKEAQLQIENLQSSDTEMANSNGKFDCDRGCDTLDTREDLCIGNVNQLPEKVALVEEEEVLNVPRGQAEKDYFLRLKEFLADEEFVDKYILSNESVSNRAILQYLMELSKTEKVNTLGRGGSCVMTPIDKPRTLSEAKRLADIILRG